MAHRKIFTPEMIENGRRRYEESDEPVRSIALDFGMHPATFWRNIELWGWTKRRARPPRALSPVMQLLEEARHVPSPARSARGTAETLAESAPPAQPAAVTAAERPRPVAASVDVAEKTSAPAPATDPPDPAVLAERMLCAIEQELSAVEAMRAHHGDQPQTAQEAAGTARTLESLTRTLREVQRLRGAVTLPAGIDEDDMPRDIDEFRHELARRIDAFVKGRTDGDAQPDLAAAGGDPPRS